MATSKIVRVPCAFVLAAALLFSTQVVSQASDDPAAATSPASASTEPAASCCPEGYVCTAADSTETDAISELANEDEQEGPVCHGVLTCSFWAGGHLIALPFRLLNAVFKVVI